MKKTVRIQVIKVYEIDVEAKTDQEARIKTYSMQSTKIEKEGELINLELDNAEIINR